MTTRKRFVVAFVALAVCIAIARAVLFYGLYGWTIFVALPLMVGALSVWVVEPKNQVRAAGVGAMGSVLGSCSFLIMGWEGIICVAMCLPVTVVFGGIAGWLTYRLNGTVSALRGTTVFLMLPIAGLSWDVNAKPQLYEVRSEITIAASAEKVWKNVVSFSSLPEPKEWYFHTGVAYPLRARIEGTGIGAVRYCEFTTGAFVEPIEVWHEPRLLKFRVTETPAPLNEWTLYGRLEAKHLHGYLVSKQGQFELTPLPDGHTRLAGTTWYQHGLWPSEYWRWWSDAIIHRIHLRVLNHVKQLSENGV